MPGPIALLCLVLGASPSSDPGTLVDRVIAVVGEEVVTESELHVEARIALAYREGEEAATSPLASELLDSLRGYVINQLVIMIHARRLGAADVSQERLTAVMDRFRSRFSSYVAYQAFLRRYGIGEETVRRILRRDLRNELFINKRLQRPGEKGTAKGANKKREEALALWLDQMKRSLNIRVLGANHRLESP